jgi:hypothetical protein
MTRKHHSKLCPVCGYALGFEAWRGESASDEICPSCGVQFGYDDCAGGKEAERSATYDALRKKWIAEGMPWRSKGKPRPEGWNPLEQLRRAGL